MIKAKKIGAIAGTAALVATMSMGLTACGGNQPANNASNNTNTTQKASVSDAEIMKKLAGQIQNLGTKTYTVTSTYAYSDTPEVVWTEKFGYDANLKMFFDDCASIEAKVEGNISDEKAKALDEAVAAVQKLGIAYVPVEKEGVIYFQQDGKMTALTDQQKVTEALPVLAASAFRSYGIDTTVTDATAALGIDREATIDGTKMIAVAIATNAKSTNAGYADQTIFLMDPETYVLKAVVQGDVAGAKTTVKTTVTNAKKETKEKTTTVASGVAEASINVIEWDKGTDAKAEDFNNPTTVDVSQILAAISKAQSDYKAAK